MFTFTQRSSLFSELEEKFLRTREWNLLSVWHGEWPMSSNICGGLAVARPHRLNVSEPLPCRYFGARVNPRRFIVTCLLQNRVVVHRVDDRKRRGGASVARSDNSPRWRRHTQTAATGLMPRSAVEHSLMFKWTRRRQKMTRSRGRTCLEDQRRFLRSALGFVSLPKAKPETTTKKKGIWSKRLSERRRVDGGSEETDEFN